MDSAAVVFGPSLAEMFMEAGIAERLAAVDRFTEIPMEYLDLDIMVAGDFLSPSLETIQQAGATSIHVVGQNQSLEDLADQMGVPLYTYSFERLDDIMTSCNVLEDLYPEADLSSFKGELNSVLDSLAREAPAEPLNVMIVIYLEEDGAITLAGHGTYYRDIIQRSGHNLSAPDTGFYPAVSVEGILSLAPDRIIILAPEHDPEWVMGVWQRNGLDTAGVQILTGDYVLVPGRELPQLARELGSCLN